MAWNQNCYSGVSSNLKMPKYIITKSVEAENISDAIEKEKDAKITNIAQASEDKRWGFGSQSND